MDTKTIYAFSTPVGGAIAIIRISGQGCARVMRALCKKTLAPRMLERVFLEHEGILLDDAMAVFFPAPRSYTGEDMLELHCHGSLAVARDVSAALVSLHCTPAEPGEFSRRAFMNGKMDLIQAEAVMDLIQAEASLSARAALLQMQGRLKTEVEAAEALLYDALTALSASIDYPEELEQDLRRSLPAQLQEAEILMEQLIQKGGAGRVLREGFRIALAGAPNAGKSSLFNAMLGFDRAIVTKEAGTTRDLIEEGMSLDGVPLRIIDMAGLRTARAEAERIGVLRAKEALLNADFILLLLDGSAALPENLDELLREAKSALLLRTKSDLGAVWEWGAWAKGKATLEISAKTGAGLDALKLAIKARIGDVGGAYVTNARHIRALADAKAAICAAKSAPDLDCAATDLRAALSALGAITGRSVDDEVIAKIFERFCVGK